MNTVGPQVTQQSQAPEALGLYRRLFPCRHHAGHAQGRSRYFLRKLPLALEEEQVIRRIGQAVRTNDRECLARYGGFVKAMDHR